MTDVINRSSEDVQKCSLILQLATCSQFSVEPQDTSIFSSRAQYIYNMVGKNKNEQKNWI